MTDDQLQFIDYRKPKLEAGFYQFDATQQFEEVTKQDDIKLCVAGERVNIDEKIIFAQYPPPGEKGDFSDTMPHISFTKGSLPWIRSAYDVDDELAQDELYEIYEPWLYLLATNERDVEQGLVRYNSPMGLDELNKGAFFPQQQQASLMADISLPESAKTVLTIDIKKSLFCQLLLNGRADDNDKDQLEYLAHIRRRWQPEGDEIKLQTTSLDDLNSGDIAALGELNLFRGSDVSVIAKDRGWLVQNSLKGDRLLDRVPSDDGSIVIQKMSLKRELSILVANRFGQDAAEDKLNEFPGGFNNQASVVSLEQYLTRGELAKIHALDENDFLRLIVLTSWEFYCKPAKINFEQRAKALDVNALKLPDDKILNSQDFKDRLQAGLIAVPHQFRQGAKSISWYRGPFTPCETGTFEQIQLSDGERGFLADAYTATDADKLLLFYEKEGMFDISYSSAYELGRFLSYKNSQFLTALTEYKSARSRYVLLADNDEKRKVLAAKKGINIAALPYAQLDANAMSLQESVIHDWLLALGDFSVVPNWYLIPEPDLLPQRSLRTFYVDPKWIQSLWLGALSLNGRAKISYQLFDECYQALWKKLPQYGALLRSDIVWAYPKLFTEMRNVHETAIDKKIDLIALQKSQQDEYTDFIEQDCALSPINIKRRLANDSLLYCTKVAFDYISVALPPESLHYGADFDRSKNTFKKDIKFRGSTLIGGLAIPMVDGDKAIIDVTALSKSIVANLRLKVDDPSYVSGLGNFKSARFSRFMLEGEPKAEFTVGSSLIGALT